MSAPIVFVSHFRSMEGRVDSLRRLTREMTSRLELEKPRTLVFLSFADEHRGVISFLHVFEDADAMDLHFEGADDRSRAAYEFMQPAGWEIYGRPSAGAMDAMREAAATAGVALTIEPEHVAGFLRAGTR